MNGGRQEEGGDFVDEAKIARGPAEPASRSALGHPISSRIVRASDWAEARGYFETSLEAPAYEGYATLQVGSGSARGGGASEGVEVPVVFVIR